MNDETLPRDACSSSSGQRSIRVAPTNHVLTLPLVAENWLPSGEPQEAADTRSLELFICLFPMWGRLAHSKVADYFSPFSFRYQR